jgi:hypothetical protein
MWFALSKKSKISIEDGKTPAILHHDIMRKKYCLLICDPVKQLDHKRPGCFELLKQKLEKQKPGLWKLHCSNVLVHQQKCAGLLSPVAVA